MAPAGPVRRSCEVRVDIARERAGRSRIPGSRDGGWPGSHVFPRGSGLGARGSAGFGMRLAPERNPAAGCPVPPRLFPSPESRAPSPDRVHYPRVSIRECPQLWRPRKSSASRDWRGWRSPPRSAICSRGSSPASLQYAEQLREVDTSGVAPTSHPLALSAPLRDDETRPSLPRDEALKRAPDADLAAGLFKVPRVLGA